MSNSLGQVDRIVQCLVLGAVTLLSGCATETLFRSRFDATQVGQPPSPTQSIGTAEVEGPAESVIVVDAPVAPSGKWVEIRHPDANGPIAGMTGNLSRAAGPGVYTFTATMFVPAGQNAASISFMQPTATPVKEFLHLDFLPNGKVRIDDDDSTISGHFEHDSPFLVQVTLNIGATSSAHVVLGGATANGVADRALIPVMSQAAQHFSAIKVWMGTPWVGKFDATNISVTRRKD